MQVFFSSDFKLGILGGGQLGKMLVSETNRLAIFSQVLDPDADAPSRHSCHKFVHGDFMDFDTVYNFGKEVNVLTIEIEHVNIEALFALEKIGVSVQPAAKVLALIQNKITQKQFFTQNELPTAPYTTYKIDELHLLEARTLPFVWKAATGGYDGKGVRIIRSKADVAALPQVACVAEDLVGIAQEIAVLVARNQRGEVAVYEPVSMLFDKTANLVEYVVFPSDLSPEIAEKAKKMAVATAQKLEICGLLAVEMFLLPNQEILINEVAPRPHNSGHLTIEACHTSQFEQHLRAVLNLPLGSTHALCPAVMANFVGEPEQYGAVFYENAAETLAISGLNLYFYGKKQTKPYRKMAHATIIGKTTEECMLKAQQAKALLKITTQTNSKA